MKTRFAIAAAVLFLASSASAQASDPNLFDYLKDHASIVSGVASANGERSEYVSFSVDDEFLLAPKWHATAGLSLFGRQRVQGGTKVDPTVPMTLDDLALYSSGQIEVGAFYDLSPKVAIECRGGVTFAMIGLTGKQGDPVDPSKYLGACGPRFSGGPGRLSVLAGHFGPVVAGSDLWGFIPTTLFDGEFALPDGVSFLVRVAAGRDRATDLAVTSSWFGVRKRF